MSIVLNRVRSAALVTLFIAGSAFAEGAVYKGEFSQIKVAGAACQSVFAEPKFTMSAYPFGSLDILMRFGALAPTTSPLDKLTLTSNVGADGDVYSDRDVDTSTGKFHVHLEGYGTSDTFYAVLDVTGPDCEAGAEFFGTSVQSRR